MNSQLATSWVRSIVVGALVFSSAAFANDFSVAVGQTKVMGVSQRVVGITIRDPRVVQVKKLKNGNGVSLLGKELGKTAIELRTANGANVEFVLHVTNKGARVFTTTRNDEVPAKNKAVAKKSTKGSASPEKIAASVPEA